MSDLIQIKRGFFHKLLSSCIVIAIYSFLFWNTFYYVPGEDGYGGLHVIGIGIFVLLNIPVCILMIMYVVYSFTASHRETFMEWAEDD